jgi:diguanylate cyclase (GGDEF)-like protein
MEQTKTKQEIKLAILKAIKDKYDGEYKYNILGRSGFDRRAVENYLGITFDEDSRHLASKCFDELKADDLIRSTHSTNTDPENWVKLTKAGLQALESGKIGQARKDVFLTATPVSKFGIPGEAVFDAELKSAAEKVGTISAIFLDLDNFKSVNDDYDHEVGDQVIREIISIIQIVLTAKGALFHRSGDEMLMLLPNFDGGEAIGVADRIRREIKEYAFSTIGTGVITATLGVSTYPTACSELEDLKVTADRTAMRAKKKGRDIVTHSLTIDEVPDRMESILKSNQRTIKVDGRTVVFKA